MKDKELKAFYDLDFRPRGIDRFPRFKRWLVMDSPKSVQKLLLRFWRGWMIENELSYILADEIRKEIDDMIIKEVMAEMKKEMDNG
jgi:hypothetical protein